MYVAIIILIVIFSALLVLVILMQDPKSGGVSSQFGGGGASQMIGAKKTTDILEKITWSFGAVLLFGSLLTNVFIDASSANGVIPQGVNEERAADKRTTAPVTPLPAVEDSGEASESEASEGE